MSNNPLIQRATTDTADSTNAAVELIRNKVEQAYREEPSATEELAEIKAERTLSKHQRYMQELSAGGKSLAEIQTAWHHYYTMLPDDEKHEVWQEFYAANQHTPYQKLFQKQVPVHNRLQATPPQSSVPEVAQAASVPVVMPAPVGHIVPPKQVSAPKTALGKTLDKPAVHKLKHQIANKVSAGGKLKLKHHVQSLVFGLASGLLVLLIALFSFFNEYIIAPFIQPSRTVSATPIIIGNGSGFDTSKPQVIIPKINVQIPLDFTVSSNNENDIENALEGGVVHYPSTVNPGQDGNAAFFGHSSNNIFNPGKYKFAFVLLHELTTGDVFYITYNNQAYAYQVFAREVVPPSEVSVLNDSKGKTATATLITCDPPGTSNNRLVVWGEQVSPNVSNNSAGGNTPTVSQAPAQLANNGPTLWHRFVNAIEFWN